MEPIEPNSFDDAGPPTGDAGPTRVLLAAPPSGRAAISRLIEDAGLLVTHVESHDDARRALAGDEHDVFVLHQAFDGDAAMRLARHVHRCHLPMRVVMLADSPSTEFVLEAFRHGVCDVRTRLDDAATIVYAIECAAQAARHDRTDADRLTRLREMCRKLNEAKLDSARQVESLCRDLAAAYEEISEQMSEVAMASEFRTLLAQELDLESLLRTSLEYLLTKTGPTNAAVLLPDAERRYSLGAYVNYSCPRERADGVIEHICAELCPEMEREEDVMRFDDADALAEWLGEGGTCLEGSDVIAFACRHAGECLAVIVLFRGKDDPFADDLAAIIDTLRPIFSRQVASIIKVHHRARQHWPEEAAEDAWDADDDYGFGLAA